MDDNLDTSTLNQEAGNRLTSEILLSSSEDSSNFGADKIGDRLSKNGADYVNGVSEVESRSFEKNYVNSDSSRECEIQSSIFKEPSRKPLDTLKGEKLLFVKKNCLSDCKDPDDNENCLSQCIDARNTENSTPGGIDYSGNEKDGKNCKPTQNDKIGNESTLEMNLCSDNATPLGHKCGVTVKEIKLKEKCEAKINDLLVSEKILKEGQNDVVLAESSSYVDVIPTSVVEETHMNMAETPDEEGRDSNVKKGHGFEKKENSSNSNHDSLEQDYTAQKSAKLSEKPSSGTIYNSKNVKEKVDFNEAKEQVNGTDEIEDEEQEVVVKESGSSVPKIHLVTTLDDVFIDEEITTVSPSPAGDSPAANPLETEHEDTNDNDDSPAEVEYIGMKNTNIIGVSSLNDMSNDGNDISNEVNDITNEVHSINNISVTLLGSGNRKNCFVKLLKNKRKSVKDVCEQDEVITGDKTVSQEYVTKNLELLGEGSPIALNDHGYSKQGTPPIEAKETRVKKNKSLKVIYPKRKLVDVNQLDIHIMPVPVLKHCLHCAKLAKCCIRIEIGGCECHLCSEECLEQHKTLQSNTLRRTSIHLESKEQNAVSETRLCVQCNSDISIQTEEKILSWETMEFCNEDCLGKYQSKMWTSCTGCSKEVPTSSMGKYCVRFGHEIKQFCCSSCLEDFKKGIKACSFCQKDLSAGDEGFLAPIADKNQFRDFCSQNCLDEYDCMSRNLPAGGLKVEACGVCDKTQLVQVQVITTSNTVNLCSEVCFKAFKFVNTSISPTPCFMCKKYFETISTNKVTVYYENEILSFCSKTCMNINILAKRRIVACNWCKVKKYNFDMIRRKSSNNIVTNWCSLNCMALNQVSMNTVSLRNKSKCAQCYKYGFQSLHLTMSDGTIRNFCSLECVNKFQSHFKGQTTNGIFPTGGPKRVVRTKTLLPMNSEKNLSFPDYINKDVSGCKLKTVNTTINAAQLIGSAVIKNKVDDVQCASPLNIPVAGAAPQNILTLQAINPDVKNAKVQVYCHKLNKAVSVKPNQSTKSNQTDEIEEKGPVMIPVPVPIYVPVPLAMYSVPVPTPFPFPIPIPVPIIIPTTRGTAEEILTDIKKIQEKMPGNPFEAELLMMAEMAEGQKKSSETEVISADASCEMRLGQKRTSDDVEQNDGPPEKKRKEDFKNNVLDNAVHHLATSQLSMSLKETLGVSAWKHYASHSGERIDLLEMRPGELAQALKRFIQNARIPGEGDYTPDQKYYLMLGIQYYLEENGRIDNIFCDKIFDPFIDALNDEAKKFQETFANSDNIITRVEEEHLWESKQLGPHSPATLLATLIYFNTKYFNLTTVEEHMQLSFSHIMKHWKRNPNSAAPTSNNSKPSNGSRNVLLRFYPPQSSLDAPNSRKKKVYEQEANEADPYRCPVQLYEFYLSKCPESVKSRNDMFYLNPERSCVPDSPIWYSTLPMDPEDLEHALNRFKMVKEINLALLSDV